MITRVFLQVNIFQIASTLKFIYTRPLRSPTGPWLRFGPMATSAYTANHFFITQHLTHSFYIIHCNITPDNQDIIFTIIAKCKGFLIFQSASFAKSEYTFASTTTTQNSIMHWYKKE